MEANACSTYKSGLSARDTIGPCRLVVRSSRCGIGFRTSVLTRVQAVGTQARILPGTFFLIYSMFEFAVECGVQLCSHIDSAHFLRHMNIFPHPYHDPLGLERLPQSSPWSRLQDSHAHERRRLVSRDHRRHSRGILRVEVRLATVCTIASVSHSVVSSPQVSELICS